MESTHVPRDIANPMSGERIVVRQTAEDTHGELLAFDLYLPPGAKVPSGHTHPTQTERFTVITGELRFRVGRRVLHAAAGHSVTVPPGTPHWFRNQGRDEAHALVEVRPALRMQELFWESGHLRELRLLGVRVPAPGALARFLRTFEAEVAVPLLPRWLVRPLLDLAALSPGRDRGTR